MGLFDTIQGINNDNMAKLPSNKLGKVKNYYNGACTVETSEGTLENIPTLNPPKIGEGCVLVAVGKDYVCIPLDLEVYTKAEIDEIIEDIISGDIDLSNYVKKSDVQLKFEIESPSPLNDSNGGYMTIGLDIGDGF